MLKTGQTFTLGGLVYTVALVNFSRAHCVTSRRESVTVRDTKKHCDRTFFVTRTQGIDISPDSPVELLADLLKGTC